MTIANTAVMMYRKVVKRVELSEFSSQGESFSFLLLYLYEMMDAH